MTSEPLATTLARQGVHLRRRRSPVSRFLRFMRTKPLAATGVIILVVFGFIAVFGDRLVPVSPTEVHREARLAAPGGAYLFGTDILGRDILSRLLVGTRLSIMVGVVVVSLGFTIGSVVGITSAYFGGKYDLYLQRVVDALNAFPTLILAIAIMAVAGQSLLNVILALTVTQVPRTSRIMRSQALSIKGMMYVDAARAMGAGHLRILLQHITPNCLATGIVIVTVSIGAIILAESSLSFLGVGAGDDIISWGGMLSGNQQRYFATAPWIGIFPGLCLTLIVFGFNVVGDALRDILDPRLRRG